MQSLPSIKNAIFETQLPEEERWWEVEKKTKRGIEGEEDNEVEGSVCVCLMGATDSY